MAACFLPTMLRERRLESAIKKESYIRKLSYKSDIPLSLLYYWLEVSHSPVQTQGHRWCGRSGDYTIALTPRGRDHWAFKSVCQYSCFPSLSLDALSYYQVTFVSGSTALSTYFLVSVFWNFIIWNNFIIYKLLERSET